MVKTKLGGANVAKSKQVGIDDVNRHFLEKLMSYILPLEGSAATEKIMTLMEGYQYGLCQTGNISEDGAQRLQKILDWLKECSNLEPHRLKR